MRASVLTPFVDITPGDDADVQIEVANSLDIVDLISFEVLDLAPNEYRLSRESLSLFPGESGVVTLTLKLRRTFPAGPGFIEVRVASALRPDLVEVRAIEIDVAPFAAADLQVSPQAVVAKSKTTLEALVTNTGNTPLTVAMLAKDDQSQLRFLLSPPSLKLEPETDFPVLIEAKGRRPLFGAPAYRTIYVSAESEAGLLDDTVSLTQRPLLVRGLLTIGILATIIALWALIVTFGVDLALNDTVAGKAVPSDFGEPISFSELAKTGGAGSTSSEAILGTVSGTVQGADSGEPLPRIAVEAHRLDPKTPGAVLGSEATLIRSAATDDEGVFTLNGIFPAKYFIKLVGSGFDDIWYPGVPTAAQAEEVTVSAGMDLVLGDLLIAGNPGTISGAVDTGGQVTPLTIVARPLVDGVPGLEVATVVVNPPDTTPADGAADGPTPYTLSGLAAPLDYRITVSSEPFADQTITEFLNAGQQLDAAPIRLVPGDGVITGTITLSGPPPDKVSVIATTGDTIFALDTPPPTNNGGTSSVEFTFSNLPTPATYDLTFTATGFEATTTSVDVVSGPPVSAGIINMNGGSRIFSGRVIDNETLIPLGDVDVTVLSAEGTTTTKTLPSPTSAGSGPTTGTLCSPNPVQPNPTPGSGTFVIDNLPLGVVSITFSTPGYESVTRRLDVTGTGAPTALPSGVADPLIKLTNRTGEVCGSVTGLSGVTVSGGLVEVRGGPRAAGSDGIVRDTLRETPLTTGTPATFNVAGLEAGEYTLTVSNSREDFDDCTVAFSIGTGTRASRHRSISIRVANAPDSNPNVCTVTP